MSLVTDIESIVTDINPDATFLLSSYFRANLKSFQTEAANYPLVIFDNEIRKTVQIMKNANLQAQTRIRIFVLNHDYPNKTDLEREAIRQAMEDIANRIMVKIFQLDNIQIIGNANQTYTLLPRFHAFLTNLSGVEAEIQANETLIINWC